MELWFTEREFTYKNVGLTIKIKEQLHHEETQFQVLDIFDTYYYGKMMTLDGVIQLTELDEFFYHEMIVHVPMQLHPNPERVLIIGGGDGGTAREVLKHKSVKSVDMVEIDEQVISISKRYFPETSSSFDNPKLNIMVADGIKHLAEYSGEKYDVILIDSSDPIGPAVGLFTKEFYTNCFDAMTENGIVVAQAGTFWYQPEESKEIYQKLKQIYKFAGLYWSITPTYPAGNMTYALGSKNLNPYDAKNVRKLDSSIKTKYYNMNIHNGAFALPSFIIEGQHNDI